MADATIINIQKYSVHDGPGIRTTVFFKGCPLNCSWCHNPESQRRNPEIMFFGDRCSGCSACVRNCPASALSMEDGIPKINSELCTLCGTCEDMCPSNAKEITGKVITSSELMKEIIKDEVFYDESGGGVTFSGGEPLAQSDFLLEILKSCNRRGIHTTLDTSGFAKWSEIEKIANHIDLFLYDIKFMDDSKHIDHTGVSNILILENLKRLSEMRKRIFIRMPIIAGINDNDKDIEEAVEFLKGLHIEQVNLLPYHRMGMEKYNRINMKCVLTGFEQPSDARMAEIQHKFEQCGIKTKIGG